MTQRRRVLSVRGEAAALQTEAGKPQTAPCPSVICEFQAVPRVSELAPEWAGGGFWEPEAPVGTQLSRRTPMFRFALCSFLLHLLNLSTDFRDM